jgi:beta-lactamase class D
MTGSNYSIYGKTGTGQITDKSFIGWYVGFLETKTNSYAYALNIFTGAANEIPGDKRQEIVKDIFADIGLIDK